MTKTGHPVYTRLNKSLKYSPISLGSPSQGVASTSIKESLCLFVQLGNGSRLIILKFTENNYQNTTPKLLRE